MTFEETVKRYPIHRTLVGFYDCEDTFECHTLEDIADMDTWIVPPFTDPQEGYYNFVRYVGNYIFESWTFSYQRVEGYLTVNDGHFIAMTYSEDFGWEEVIADDDNTIIVPPLSDEEVSIDDVVSAFDMTSYLAGRIFTTREELEEFVKAGKF